MSTDDLALALELADAADAVTMARFGTADLRVETKPDMTLVSDADRAVEQQLRAGLAAARPGDGMLGEEFGETGGTDRRWIADPIDGTNNFVRGVPVWATLLALMEGGQVTVGVVSAPALGRRWWAAAGRGAWGSFLGGEPRRLHVSGVRELADASLSYSSIDTPGVIRLGRQVWRTRAYGDFWSYALVAEGAVDIATEPSLSLWDVAALVPLVTEAGGQLTDLAGAPGPGASALATNGHLHEVALGYLRPAPGR